MPDTALPGRRAPRPGRLAAVAALAAALVVATLPAVAAAAPAPTDEVAAAAAARGGFVRTGGAAPALGGPGDLGATTPGAAILASDSGQGYLVVDSGGAVFVYGDATYRGGLAGVPLTRPVVGATATPSGDGYWLVASDGGIFSFGDAGFHGSTGAIRLNQPIVGMAATPSGDGYWMVASDGGIFAFGDAGFHGSLGSIHLNRPIVGMAATPSGDGYWLVADDGGVFAFGDAQFLGSAVGGAGVGATVAIAGTTVGQGYWLVDDRGVVSAFGNAGAVEPVADVPVAEDVVDAAIRPQADGVWVLLVPHPEDTRFPVVPAESGSGRRIVYSNSLQRVWLIEGDGVVFDSYLVSGRRGVPAPGTYSVFSKSVVASSGSLRLDNMVRFAHGRTLAIGFHSIPTRPGGQPIQGLDELGEYRSHGCVRQDPAKAAELFAWAPIGTVVVVLP